MRSYLRGFAAAGLLAAAVSTVCAQDVTGVAVTSAQYTGSGLSAPDPRYMGKDASGNLVVLNHNVSNNAAFALVRINVSGATPAFTTLATGGQLLSALTAVGITAPASVTVRGMDVAQNGSVILVTDDNTAGSYLFRVTSPGTVEVLAGKQTESPVDGANGLACVGNTACVFIENSFDASAGTDHVQAFDVTAAADGLQAGVEVASEANILAAIAGATQATVRMSAGVAAGANKVLIANSGNAGATDELLLVDVVSKTVTLAKSKAAQLSDISDTDVGYNAVAYHAGSDTAYAWNNFGVTAGKDDDLLKLTAGGTGTLSVFVTDSAVEADTDFTSNGGTVFNVSNYGMVVIGDVLYWNDYTAKGTYKMSLTATTAVKEWTLY